MGIYFSRIAKRDSHNQRVITRSDSASSFLPAQAHDLISRESPSSGIAQPHTNASAHGLMHPALENARAILEDENLAALDRFAPDDKTKPLEIMQLMTAAFAESRARLNASDRLSSASEAANVPAVQFGYREQPATSAPSRTASPHPEAQRRCAGARHNERKIAYDMVLNPIGRAVLQPMYQGVIKLHQLDKLNTRLHSDVPPLAFENSLFTKVFPGIAHVSVELHERRLQPM